MGTFMFVPTYVCVQMQMDKESVVLFAESTQRGKQGKSNIIDRLKPLPPNKLQQCLETAARIKRFCSNIDQKKYIQKIESGEFAEANELQERAAAAAREGSGVPGEQRSTACDLLYQYASKSDGLSSLEAAEGSLELKIHNCEAKDAAQICDDWYSITGKLVGTCFSSGMCSELPDDKKQGVRWEPGIAWSGTETIMKGWDTANVKFVAPSSEDMHLVRWRAPRPRRGDYSMNRGLMARGIHAGISHLFIDLKKEWHYWRFLYLDHKQLDLSDLLRGDYFSKCEKDIITLEIRDRLLKVGFINDDKENKLISDEPCFILIGWDTPFVKFAKDYVDQRLFRYFEHRLSCQDEYVRLTEGRVAKYCNNILLNPPASVRSMSDSLGYEHLPTTPKGMVEYCIVNPLVAEVEASGQVASEVLQGKVSNQVICALRSIEQNDDLSTYRSPGYWARFVLLSKMHVELPDWCHRASNAMQHWAASSPRGQFNFNYMRINFDNFVGGNAGENANNLRHMMWETARSLMEDDSSRIFFHGTRATVAEQVMMNSRPSASPGPGSAEIPPDFGPRFYTSEDPLIAAHWIWDRVQQLNNGGGEEEEVPVVIAFAVDPNRVNEYPQLQAYNNYAEVMYAYHHGSFYDRQPFQSMALIFGPMKQTLNEAGRRRDPAPSLEEYANAIELRTRNGETETQVAFDEAAAGDLSLNSKKCVFVLGHDAQ
eukprot:gb/GECG01011087.1/.p1 GENE.gb/GECG01011087.1/~~gb/GECG01011087.1/.p1  ORF type:complete len:711 (+),score=86.85 gb/GECG01011087.1/:1-2133(+)